MIRLHTIENNAASQLSFEFNKARLSKQCVRILGILNTGARLTVRDALVNHDIGDLRRRVADLKESGVPVKGDTINSAGTKEYYLLTPFNL